MKLSNFIRKYKLQVTCKPGPYRSGWMRGANYYRCQLRGPHGAFTVPFLTGSGWTQDPTTKDVVGSLQLDASFAAQAGSAEDMARDLGLDLSDRKQRLQAYNVYRSCEATCQKLRRVLGDDAYEQLLWSVEED